MIMAAAGQIKTMDRVIHADILVDATMGPAMRLLSAYTFVYTLEGSADYRDANGLKRTIGPGDLIFVFPDLPHNYNPSPGSHWKQFYVMVDSPIFTLWDKHGYLDSTQPIHHAEPIDYWLKRLWPFTRSYMNTNPREAMLHVLQLQQLLTEVLIAEDSDAVSQHDQAWIQKACELIDTLALNRTPIPKIAKTLDMSYENFRKRFTRLLRMSPTQYLNKRIADRVCRLMQETNLSNKEIAYQLGFCDEFHFSHRFKQITGRSPKEYRRTLPIRTSSR